MRKHTRKQEDREQISLSKGEGNTRSRRDIEWIGLSKLLFTKGVI